MRDGNRDFGERKRIVIGTLDFGVIRALGGRFHSDEYEITYCQRGSDILIDILDHDVDLLILDVEVGGLLGMELLPVVRRIRPKLPVILVTDDFTKQIRKVAAEQGITYQAVKPMSDSETDAIVQATEAIIEKSHGAYC